MKENQLTIYLADDDEDDRLFFEDAIDELDEEIALIMFDSGIDLLKTLLNSAVKKPNFIFLDLNMPLMNGEECLDEIRASDTLKDIPVVIYSTSIDFSNAERFTDAGANFYLKKPNNFEELKAAILNCLTQYRDAEKNI